MNEQIKSIVISFGEKLGASGLDVTIEDIADTKKVIIRVEDDRVIVGKEESNFEAFTHLLKRMIAKVIGEDKKVSVDVNDRRLRQDEMLKTKAKIIAERAKEFKRDVEMEPMSSYERMLIHTVLEEIPFVKTESIGEGRNRRVVVRFIEEPKETF